MQINDKYKTEISVLAILKTIELCVNKTIDIRYWYLKPFKCVQIKVLLWNSNTWNPLTVYRQMINTKQNISVI